MSGEAFGWVTLLGLWLATFGLGACVFALFKWHERRTKPRLPPPEWRARVHQRQTHTAWRIDK